MNHLTRTFGSRRGLILLLSTLAALLGLAVLLSGSASTAGSPALAHEDPANTETPIYTVFIPHTSNELLWGERTVSVLVSGQQQDAVNLDEALDSFEVRTGIDVITFASDTFNEEILQRAADNNLPDLALFIQPGLLGELVAGGYTIDLNDWFTSEYLQEQYSDAWLDYATIDGQMAGLWYKAGMKSLVYYPLDDFQAAGYAVPTTWAELLALSDQIVSDGTTPWCIGIESGLASGWVGTDWVEDILLRTQPVEKYDQWVDGTLPFSSPEVRAAFQRMAEIWFDEDYVSGGRGGIATTFFGDAPQPMFQDPPGCFLHRQATFIPLFFPEGVEYGVDWDYFYLPPVDPQEGKPVLIAGDVFGVFHDRPEVRQLAEFVSTGESVRYYMERGEAVAPHNDANPDWYQDDAWRGYAQILGEADVVRFDASDMMPGEVGARAFWDGIVDYVTGTDLNTVLATIDAAWPP